MERSRDKAIEVLRRQGVTVMAPETQYIGDEVHLDWIQGPGTVIHPGARLTGPDLRVLPGAQIGTEGPATVHNCAVGRRVELAGGYFADAVFLTRSKMGLGAHVRAGTLLEEQANGAHTVGLKQTILMPFVTLGSLINFCDVLMAGGTSRQDHSEVGSSFIHFNFTPFGKSGDKATPSLVGDVARGVTLRAPRIFLGGQGGLVGPVHIDYGTVLAAGYVYRHDHGTDQLVIGEKLATRSMSFDPLRYSRIRHKVEANLRYIGNLVALWHWYDRVRLRVAAGDPDRLALYRRGRRVVALGIVERAKRLGQIAGYMDRSIASLERASGPAAEIKDQRRFAEVWAPVEDKIVNGYRDMGLHDDADLAQLIQKLDEALNSGRRAGYLELIQGLDQPQVDAGTRWLQRIVQQTRDLLSWD